MPWGTSFPRFLETIRRPTAILELPSLIPSEVLTCATKSHGILLLSADCSWKGAGKGGFFKRLTGNGRNTTPTSEMKSRRDRLIDSEIQEQWEECVWWREAWVYFACFRTAASSAAPPAIIDVRWIYCIVFKYLYSSSSHGQTEALLVRLAPRKETSFKSLIRT